MLTDSKYLDVQLIDEHMTQHMCYGIGIDRVLDALQLCEPKVSPAWMYYYILRAEHNSSMAKYIDPELYALKEESIQALIDVCRKWRNPRSTHIVETKTGSNSSRGRNFINRSWKYIFINKEDALDFGYTSGEEKWGPQYIYYFNVPGCEQVSYHTDVSPSLFNGELKRYTNRWDMLQSSTLMKIEYAICRKYGSLLKVLYDVDVSLAADYDEMLERNHQRRLQKQTGLVATYIDDALSVLQKYASSEGVITSENAVINSI